MTFQVLILLLFFVSAMDTAHQRHSIIFLSSCRPESGKEGKLLVVPLPLSAFFFFFFCSSKQKCAGLGALQVARFPLRGGVKGLGVGSVCSGVSPSI